MDEGSMEIESFTIYNSDSIDRWWVSRTIGSSKGNIWYLTNISWPCSKDKSHKSDKIVIEFGFEVSKGYSG